MVNPKIISVIQSCKTPEQLAKCLTWYQYLMMNKEGIDIMVDMRSVLNLCTAYFMKMEIEIYNKAFKVIK